MNFLFINPPSENKKKYIRLIDCSHEAKASYLWQPNDFMIISSYFKEEDNYYLIDGTVDQLDSESFYKEVNNLKNVKFDVVFFATGSACYYEDLFYYTKLRETFYYSTICVLGDVFVEKNFREDIFKRDVDAIIFKPYDLDLSHISQIRKLKIEKKDFSFVDCVITHPDNHPFDNKAKKLSIVDSDIPKHGIFKKKYSWPFLTTKNFTTITSMWGCTYSCSYCTSGIMHPISRSNNSIIKEIEFIKKSGFKEIQFFDKVFGIPKIERIKLMKEIIEKKLTIPFSCYFHPSMYDPEFLELMKKSGCHTIIIGIDSADLESLALYNRKVTQKVLDLLIKHANDLNINVCADFIIGLPHEKEEDVLKTVEYSKKIKIDFASFNIAAPLPGSSFRKDAIKKGTINAQDLSDTLNTSFSSQFISAERLIEIRKKANFEFYFRFSMIFRRLRRLRSFEHFFIQLNQMFGIIRNNF